jgi:predicted ATPase
VPLAIELAAASLATDSLTTVQHNVEDPLRHIRPRRRGSPAHHRSLDAALRRSLGTLTAEERRLFTRLGSLPGTFTIDDLDTGGTGRVREVLGGLVEKSLLSVEEGTYRMLGIIRSLAADGQPQADTARRAGPALADGGGARD